MLSLFNIWTVARYEAKTLFRSWFFRIFTIISVLILTFMTVFILTLTYAPYMFRGLSASIPYINLKLMNVCQAIIIIFLAADFLKRDRKLDSTETIYTRSMTNADYVFGKSLGILIVFTVLNLIIITIAGFIHLFFAKSLFVGTAYLVYFLYLTFPTMIFVLGSTFFLMSLLRNQAVTFIILLAYVGGTLFYLGYRFHSIFDFMAFFLPGGYSDFIGLGLAWPIIFQRLAYLFFGLSFIFFTILMLKRLVQSKAVNQISLILGILFFIMGVGSIFQTYDYIFTGRDIRHQQRELFKANKDQPVAKINKMALNVHQQDGGILCEAMIKFENSNPNPLEKYLFSLNPGMKVKKISSQGVELKFERNKQLLWIYPTEALSVNQVDSIVVHYAGKIDETYMYLDVEDEQHETSHRIWLYNFQKRYAFSEKDYILFTPESNWYPVAGFPYGANYPDIKKKDFINFDLTVTPSPDLMAISQGNLVVEKGKSSQYHFQPEQPLSEISLAIGNYEKREVTVDSVEYELFTLKSHDFFIPYLDSIGDTLGALIRETKNDLETVVGLPYVFQRLRLVETPVHFSCFKRTWTLAWETVQPEMVLLPELGISCESIGFDDEKRRMNERSKRDGRTYTEQENQSRMLRNFLVSNLTGLSGGSRFNLRNRIPGLAEYKLLPIYYYFSNHFHSEQWPIFNQALEAFIHSRIPETSSSFARALFGLTAQEKSNLALDGQNLPTVLADTSHKDLRLDLIKYKGNSLFLGLQKQLGEEKFTTFLHEYIIKNNFKDISVEQFIRDINYRRKKLITTPFTIQ